ncbi:MAG TPA: hypothetical protein VF179_21855 [Thermoanaerobaculia bacterium]|nr:hypothetical protein [Thermoanaerobaculia bacterium]
MDIEVIALPGGGARVRLIPGEWTDIETLSREGLEWTTLGSLTEVLDSTGNIRVCGGEGGMGADGFVAVAEASQNRLQWIAFFENSNPFVEVGLEGNQITAKTSLPYVWRFPLDSPADVWVEPSLGPRRI